MQVINNYIGQPCTIILLQNTHKFIMNVGKLAIHNQYSCEQKKTNLQYVIEKGTTQHSGEFFC